MKGGALSERIMQRLPEMTPQVALGARFIVDHPDTMVMSSMREIAGRVGVAPATLLRLARMLGHDDWSGFRDVYVEHFRSSSPHYAEKADALSKRQGIPALVDEVTRAQVAALQHAASANTPESIDAAAKVLGRARRIFVAAFMSCRAPGLAFTYICRLFRSDVTLLGADGASLVADLADLRSDDAVLSINFLPYAREIHLVASAVARSGAALVSIADSRVTPLSQHARSILLFGAESPSFFPSITSAVALVESVAAAMLAHAGDGAVTRVRAVEKALYSSGSYVNE
jgi:DNA-binding MurR/RpiR family transcriptional regulator